MGGEGGGGGGLMSWTQTELRRQAWRSDGSGEGIREREANVLPGRILLGGAAEACHVTPGVGLRDAEADHLGYRWGCPVMLATDSYACDERKRGPVGSGARYVCSR